MGKIFGAELRNHGKLDRTRNFCGLSDFWGFYTIIDNILLIKGWYGTGIACVTTQF